MSPPSLTCKYPLKPLKQDWTLQRRLLCQNLPEQSQLILIHLRWFSLGRRVIHYIEHRIGQGHSIGWKSSRCLENKCLQIDMQGTLSLWIVPIDHAGGIWMHYYKRQAPCSPMDVYYLFPEPYNIFKKRLLKIYIITSGLKMLLLVLANKLNAFQIKNSGKYLQSP